MAQDHYEILQVHPRADSEAISAAYARLRALYDPEQLDGAADELVELARLKRDQIERAYAVLSDPVRRASFDAELTTALPARPAGSVAREPAPQEELLLDYRPLPPARRAERSRAFEGQIPALRSAAEQNPNDPQAWIDYGDLLYNSAEIVRENAPQSAIYQQRLPRWLEATQAYTRALALEPDNALTRADLGASACF